MSERLEKKLRVAAAAVRLFEQHGLANTTVDMIASEAGVSQRTFFRYFDSKEAAAFPDHSSRVADMRQRLEARLPSDRPLHDAAEISQRAAREYFDEPELYHRRYRLLRSNNTLRDLERAFDRTYEDCLAHFLANCDFGPFVARAYAAAVVAVVNEALDLWACSRISDPASADAALDQGLAMLVNAFSSLGLSSAGNTHAAEASTVVAVEVPPHDPLFSDLRAALERGAKVSVRRLPR